MRSINRLCLNHGHEEHTKGTFQEVTTVGPNLIHNLIDKTFGIYVLFLYLGIMLLQSLKESRAVEKLSTNIVWCTFVVKNDEHTTTPKHVGYSGKLDMEFRERSHHCLEGTRRMFAD